MSSKRAQRLLSAIQEEEDPEFQIAPMIDMLLVLLIFFMSITTTNVMLKDKFVILPPAKNGKNPEKATDVGETIINVRWAEGRRSGGDIWIDDQPVGLQLLSIELARRKAAFLKVNPRAKYRVLVRADGRVQYRFTQDLLRECATAGISAITFAVLQGGDYTQPGGGS
jgi:biopolymer transport protein ExbD